MDRTIPSGKLGINLESPFSSKRRDYLRDSTGNQQLFDKDSSSDDTT